MIMGDMGVRATEEIIEELKQKDKENKVKDPQACRQLLIDTIREKIALRKHYTEMLSALKQEQKTIHKLLEELA